MKRKMFLVAFSLILSGAIQMAVLAQQIPGQSLDQTIAAGAGPWANPGAGAERPAGNSTTRTTTQVVRIPTAANTESLDTSVTRETRTPAHPGPQTPPTSNNQTDIKCPDVIDNPRNSSRFDVALCGLVMQIVEARIKTRDSKQGITLASESGRSFLPILLLGTLGEADGLAKLILEVESSRTDKQLGADDKGAGSTSVAVRGGIPTVLSWAVENGAATASSSGTTLTFRVNPVGFIEGLSGQGYLNGPNESQYDTLTKFLRNTSVGFTFDTSRGTDRIPSNVTTAPVFTGDEQQLSALSFRYQLINRRDPRHPQYVKDWDAFFHREALELGAQQSAALQKLREETTFRNKNLQDWLQKTNEELGAITVTESNKGDAIEEMRRIVLRQLSELPISELQKDPEVIDAINSFVGAYQPYLQKRSKILDQVAKGALVTFEYTNYREVNAPDVSNFRFIAEKATYGLVNLTANASISLYNKLPKMMTPAGTTVGADIKRIRDFSFTGQAEVPLRNVMGLGDSHLSFAGKYQRLTSDAVALDGTVLPNTKGDIAVGQIKLVIPLMSGHI
jgi:hypothetical protein